MRFEYLEPELLEEALQLLEKYRERARILAGGTDLVVQMRQGTLRPEFVVHMGLIPGLEGIAPEGEGFRVGALTTLRALEKSAMLRGPLEILRQGAAQVSCPQIRNVATLGGNSCNGAPSADTVPGLIALEAEAIIRGPRGERKVPLEKFHCAPGRTVLNADEILLGFSIPPPPPFTGGSYKKYTPRGTSELAIVGVAALVTLRPEDGGCRRARLVLGACGPTPLRIREAESVLVGSRLEEDAVEEAARIAAAQARPNPGISVRASAEYRREMVCVFSRYALREAKEKAISNPNRSM